MAVTCCIRLCSYVVSYRIPVIAHALLSPLWCKAHPSGLHLVMRWFDRIATSAAAAWEIWQPAVLAGLLHIAISMAQSIENLGHTTGSSCKTMQVSTAYKCAVVLRDLIAPYLLRRRKADVAKSLPKKTEQVLFVQLGNEQRDLYCSYLASQEVEDILEVSTLCMYWLHVAFQILTYSLPAQSIAVQIASCESSSSMCTVLQWEGTCLLSSRTRHSADNHVSVLRS